MKFLVVKSNKIDIYGRYIADVFFGSNEETASEVAANGVYLNQLLLDKGLAAYFAL